MYYWVVGSTLVITVILSISDYFMSAEGRKHFGCSNFRIWATNIGLTVGLPAPISFKFLIEPFLAAVIAELAFNPENHTSVFKVAKRS
jgi:uncharacterized protein YqgC (DUF456 family)